MSLKYGFEGLFRGRIPRPQQLFETLEDLDDRISNGVEPKVNIKEDVEISKKGLKKAFGDPKKFNSFGVVKNTEGCYLIVSDGKQFKQITLENI